ncbi:MAG TPA: hypothetical protein VJ437_09855, partial [Acidiferrobacterales bacterium]|nr:hypothetical protein [Acidiferrobacterales bacterium]
MPFMRRDHSPFGGLANTGSALNIRVYLRSSAAGCFFKVDALRPYPNDAPPGKNARGATG